ncbi:hypothetical protein BD414DRAFT_208836 [Trametes punicea]|nr:hypothetical protein BD414DRAFT_208836 [Trametes punicea]
MEGRPSFRISCRMVCTDQWLVTHVDPSWPISQLKRVLLSKFARSSIDIDNNQRSISVSPRKARRRSLSPITFAAPSRKLRFTAVEKSVSTSSEEGNELERTNLDLDEEDDASDMNVNQTFADAHRYKYDARPSTSSISDSLARRPPDDSSGFVQEATAYIIISFSTTQILEDRFSLEWYGIHPDELLELHPRSHSLASLPRFSLDEYIAPYFAARVWAFRIADDSFETTLRNLTIPDDSQAEDDGGIASPRSPLSRDKSKKKLEWKERWAIIHQGVLFLCKDRHDSYATFSAPLSSLVCIKDGSHFSLPLRSSRLHPSPALSQKLTTSPASDIICLKFVDAHSRQRTMNDTLASPEWHLPEVDGPSSPGTWWRRGGREGHGSLSSSLASSASALIGSPSGSGLAEMWDSLARRGSRSGLEDLQCEEHDSVWIVLDMLSGSAFSHILRVLHREAPSMCDSSYLPLLSPARSAPSPIVFNTRTSSPISPSDLLVPGLSSSYTFPSPPSLPLSPSAQASLPSGAGINSADVSNSFPSLPSSPAPPTRPATPVGPPKLRLNTCIGRHGVPYPDWRLALVRKARRAGLGAVGRAMELVMFGHEDDDDNEHDEDELAIQWARRPSGINVSPVSPPGESNLRPRSERHLSESAVPFIVSPSAAGEFDSTHPERRPFDDSDDSEMEWENWIDVTIMQRARDGFALPGVKRTETLETAVPGDPHWGSPWGAGIDIPAAPSAAPIPEYARAEPGHRALSYEQQSSSEVEADVEGDGSSINSNDPAPRSRPTSYYRYHRRTSSRSLGRSPNQVEHGSRTLSSYSSADSLFRRTIRTAIGSSKMKRASTSISASSSELNLDAVNEPPLRRSASSSPPLSRPSLTSVRSVASSRPRPLSPLCAQVREDEGPANPRVQHPIPLPGMPIVPSGYTTFRHSALYGRGSRSASVRGSTPSVEEDETPHAGLAHGESLQRLPMPLSMMMTTVSSTVSVGTEGKMRKSR